MDVRAIEKALSLIDRMQISAETLSRPKSPSAIREAWIDFITAAARFYSTLLQGSKGNSASEKWYRNVMIDRENDELLAYIRQARNSEEHGIAAISTINSKKFKLNKSNSRVVFESNGIDCWTVVEGHESGEFSNDVVRLLTVTNPKHGTRFNPPQAHFGKLIVDPSAAGVSQLALDYFKSLTEQATKLVPTND